MTPPDSLPAMITLPAAALLWLGVAWPCIVDRWTTRRSRGGRP